MNENATGFVKKEMVKAAEPYRIGLPVAQAASAVGRARARLVSQEGTTAMVEVLCSCGKRIQLNCEYEAQEPPG